MVAVPAERLIQPAPAAPRLQLVAAHRAPVSVSGSVSRRAASRREAAYAVALTLVLAVGILGVLALNTLMQQQARTIAAERAVLAQLALRQQVLQTAIDQVDSPQTLAERARALHMKPATELIPLRPAVARKLGPGTTPTHGG